MSADPTAPGAGPTSFRRSPLVFLSVLAAINWFGFAVWNALINNFAKEAGGFDGFAMGVLQSVREVPGLLAVTALIFLVVLREQALAYASLVLLGLGVAASGYFPSEAGLWATTFVMSAGFHFYETMAQSLSLQLFSRAEAPRVLGRLSGVNAGAQLAGFGGVALVWWAFAPGYTTVFLVSGAACVVAVSAAIVLFPRFEGPVRQRRSLVLRQRYWLYYALTFMTGARRQIFTAFGVFLLVEKFGYGVAQISSLMLVTYAVNMVAAPRLGALIGRFGERRTIMIENVSLILVFAGYALSDEPAVAAACFVVDGVFLTFTIAQRTYFQKIADPADILPTAGVAFSINHIAAVFIPVLFGLVWLRSPSTVFVIGAALSTVSLGLAFLVPRHPEPGRETTVAAARPAVAE